MRYTLVTIGLLAAASASAQTASDQGPTISATATAQVTAPAASADLTLGVESRAPQATNAASANARTMTAVVAAIVAAGIPKSAISTTGYSLNQEVEYQPPVAPNQPQTKVTRYLASNTVSVHFDALDQIGKVIDAAVKAGATDARSLTFAPAGRDSLRLAAIEAASIQARSEVMASARALGIKLGDPLTVSVEPQSAIYQPAPMFKMASMSAASTPIEAPNSIVVRATVQITFKIIH